MLILGMGKGSSDYGALGLCPHADEVVITACQMQQFWRVGQALREPLDCHIKVKQEGAFRVVSHVALYPEEAAHARALCNRADAMQAACRIEDHMTGR